MENLEGGALRTPVQPALAYLAGEADGSAGHRDGIAVRQDSADGDIVEATFTADVLTLQRQLDEQERETERVRQDTLELRNELSAVKAESATLKKTLPEKIMPEDSETTTRLVSDAFAELAKVRTESFKARKELERERNEHRAEMVRARVQYQTAQDDLQRLIKARRPAGPPVPPPKPPVIRAPVVVAEPEGRGGKLFGAAAVLAIVLSAPLLWPRVSKWSQERAEKVPIREPAPLETAQVSSLPLTPAARAQFQGAVGRLSRVLAARSGRAPQDLLRDAHEKFKASDPSLCAFDWRNGQPSLLYSGGHLSLGQTIQRCADAIEKSP